MKAFASLVALLDLRMVWGWVCVVEDVKKEVHEEG